MAYIFDYGIDRFRGYILLLYNLFLRVNIPFVSF